MISSVITPIAQINQDKWCVTLVSEKNCHAALIFEGIKEDGYFATKAHLVIEDPSSWNFFRTKLTGYVTTKKYGKDFENSYHLKTDTWILTKEKIEGLIDRIELRSGQKYRVPFLIYGGKTLLASDAETYSFKNKILECIFRNNEELFLSLYDSAMNEGKCTGMTLDKFNESIESTIESIKSKEPESAHLFKKGVKYNYDVLICLCSDEGVSKEEAHQNNCFTWAKSQLGSIGIDIGKSVGEIFLSKIVSPPCLHTTRSATSKGEIKDLTKTASAVESSPEEGEFLSRSVSYKTKRDKRTEAFKEVQSRNTKIKVEDSAGIALGLLSIAPVFITATLSTPATIGCFISTIVSSASSLLLQEDSREKLRELKNDDSIQKKITSEEFKTFEKDVIGKTEEKEDVPSKDPVEK